MSKDGRIWLSHTGIETLERCPRCFWLLYKRGIKQPEGIVSRLANRFDTILKNYFQIFRESGELPPLVKGQLEGKLQNPFQEKYFIPINMHYGFYGKLDECLINEREEHIPVDFKTASTDPRDKETLSSYQSQIDDYLFLLRKSEKKTAGFGYLIYFYPDKGEELHKGFPMITHIVKVEGSPQRTELRIKRAISILENPLPEANPQCNFCDWFTQVKTELALSHLGRNKKEKGGKKVKGIGKQISIINLTTF